MKFLFAIFALWFALALIPDHAKPQAARPAGERRSVVYPGTCPNGQTWYLIESSDDSATLGCYDPDYDPSE